MVFFLGRVRYIAAGAIGAGSILAGLALAFRLVTPGLVEHLPTFELLGLLGLLILPLLTLWALTTQRRAAARIPVLHAEPMRPYIVEPKPIALELMSESIVAEEPRFAEAEVADQEIEVHAPGRRTVRHRRHEPLRATA